MLRIYLTTDQPSGTGGADGWEWSVVEAVPLVVGAGTGAVAVGITTGARTGVPDVGMITARRGSEEEEEEGVGEGGAPLGPRR